MFLLAQRLAGNPEIRSGSGAPERALASVTAGTAKLRFWDSVLVQALIPSNSPRELINAPPLLPGEIGAEC